MRRRSTPLYSIGVRPADLCADCGHPASDHGDNLPAPCWSGCPDEVCRPEVITAEVVEALSSAGCRCIGFVPAEGFEPRDPAADTEAALAGRSDGLGPVQHVAGPLVNGAQRCLDCGGLILDLRRAHDTSDIGGPCMGFAEGPIVAHGSSTATKYDPAATACSDLGAPS